MDIDIKKISKLSRLEIDEADIEKFTNDMYKIVNMVENLPNFDNVDEILDYNYTMKLREDVVETDKFSRDELLKNAPATESGCLVVPKTVKE